MTLGKLACQTTYYWAVDEVDAAGNTQAGQVWSFTTVSAVAKGGVKGEYFTNTSRNIVGARR